MNHTIPSELSRPLPAEYPSSVIAVNANQMVVQRAGSEVTLSFFDFPKPPQLRNGQSNDVAVEQAGAVNGTCVSRIVISPAQLNEFAQALHDAAPVESATDNPFPSYSPDLTDNYDIGEPITHEQLAADFRARMAKLSKDTEPDYDGPVPFLLGRIDW